MDLDPSVWTLCFTKMSEIIPQKLFLANWRAAEDIEQLEGNKITHILTVACDIQPKHPEKFQYKVIDVEDIHYVDLKQHFNECIEFIDKCLESGGRIVVHCAAGVSRSATITIAYLMIKNKWKFG